MLPARCAAPSGSVLFRPHYSRPGTLASPRLACLGPQGLVNRGSMNFFPSAETLRGALPLSPRSAWPLPLFLPREPVSRFFTQLVSANTVAMLSFLILSLRLSIGHHQSFSPVSNPLHPPKNPIVPSMTDPPWLCYLDRFALRRLKDGFFFFRLPPPPLSLNFVKCIDLVSVSLLFLRINLFPLL